MPKGFIRHNLYGENVSDPAFAAYFGMQEHSQSGYASRTAANIADSDGTLQIYLEPNSPGELLTTKKVLEYRKPLLVVDLRHGYTTKELDSCFERFVQTHSIRVLNVAGNSEKTVPAITASVLHLLVSMLTSVSSLKDDSQ